MEIVHVCFSLLRGEKNTAYKLSLVQIVGVCVCVRACRHFHDVAADDDGDEGKGNVTTCENNLSFLCTDTQFFFSFVALAVATRLSSRTHILVFRLFICAPRGPLLYLFFPYAFFPIYCVEYDVVGILLQYTCGRASSEN